MEWLQGRLMTALRLLDAQQGSQLAEELAREMGDAESGGELNASGLRTPDAGAGALDTMERTRQRSRETVRPR